MLNNLHSFAACAPRLHRGLLARNPAPHAMPEAPLELYEFESCPYCRKVREVLTELDIGYVARTTGRGSANRATVVDLGGKAQFPFLVDPNTGRQLYESEDIITYLSETYGAGRNVLSKALAPLNMLGATLASAVRPFGGRAAAARTTQPEELLELWQFEASPFCRKVRETMVALDLDYQVHNVGKGGRRRKAFRALSGRMMVPYLVDPNTGEAMHESDDIIAYLHATYGNPAA